VRRINMRDYAQGAFEALSWVRVLFKRAKTRCKGCEKILEEVENTVDEIQNGAAVDFRVRIRGD
jgi:exonuclease VII small subunit